MLVPKLRFKREDGADYPEWEETDLNSIGSFYGGLSGKTKENFGKGNSKFVTYMNVYKNVFASQEMLEFVDVSDNEKQNKVQYGDLLMTQSSETVEEVGMSSVYLFRDEPYLNSFCFGLHLHNLDYTNPMYVGYLMRSESIRKQIMSEGQGISRINLSPNRIRGIILPIPCLEEQQKIADFLSTVDEVIAQSEAEVQNLEQQKKAAMQKIFSQEVRFKREDGTEYPEWVESTIGEEMGFVNGKAHENCEDDNGDYIIVNSKFISTNGEVIRKTNTVLVPLHIGDIVMVMSDVPNGKAMSKCLVIDKDKQYTLNQRICALRSTHKPIFVSAQISRCAYFLSFDDGVKQTNLRKQDVLDCPLFIADKEEQQKIADFLSAYDEAISYAKQELDKWKELKKGLLQQMFV